jgi:hypothetical protein
VLTTSKTIEVNRTVDRDGYVGLGGHKVLLDPPWVASGSPYASTAP